eukprot:6177173-Pleurochrysis_carterae.AAC.2
MLCCDEGIEESAMEGLRDGAAAVLRLGSACIRRRNVIPAYPPRRESISRARAIARISSFCAAAPRVATGSLATCRTHAHPTQARRFSQLLVLSVAVARRHRIVARDRDLVRQRAYD